MYSMSPANGVVFHTWLSCFNDCVPQKNCILSVSATRAASARPCKTEENNKAGDNYVQYTEVY